MSVGRSGNGARRGDAASRRSRAGRTLVALLGVGSIALTTAAAQPLGPRELTRPGDVFALGEGGLGSIDQLLLQGEGAADPGRGRGPGSVDTGGDVGFVGSVGSDGGLGVGSDLGFDLGFDLGYLDPGFGGPVLGQESLASSVPSGFGGLGDSTGIPAVTLRAYRAAAEVLAREAPGCGIDWALIAGIGRVEANHGRFGGATVSEQGVSAPRILGPRLDGSLANTQVIRDTDGGTLDGDAVYDRAVGPMQFLPGTWKRWGSDGDRDGVANPQDIDDAALAAARYLCQGRSGLSDPAQAALAVRRYNNSAAYVDLVLRTAAAYRDGLPFGVEPAGAMPPPPGWSPPLGTVVGGPVTPSVEPSAPPSTPAVPTPKPEPQSTGPTSPPSAAPSKEPSAEPTGSPTTPPSAEPTGEPSTTPAPSEVPTLTPGPTEPVCDPAASAAPSIEPGSTPSPITSLEPQPSTSPTCLAVPSGEPTP